MKIWYIFLRKSLEIQTSLIFFERTVNRFKRAWCTLDIMRQIACLVFNQIMAEGYAALFSSTAVVQASDSKTASFCILIICNFSYFPFWF